MKTINWESNKRYSEHTAPGWIPENTKIQFKADKTYGRIIHGNGERSLVEYNLTTGGTQREWFNNSELKIDA